MNRVFFIALLITIWGCANRVSPTGGPKDEDPPILTRSNPENGQRNFKRQEFELEFNEFITLKNLKEQLIITPRIDSDYESKFRKRTVYLEFETPFSDSTTYTLNFREGVVDITENQPAENLQIAFSTGNLLDTLEVYGSVLNMFTKEPMKNVTVGLYSIDDTLNIFTGPPYYFAKTDDEGHYHFRNIKDGEYKLYAFQDGNKNLTSQSDNESYGFLSNPIQLDTALVADTVYMESMNIDTLEMIRVRPSGLYFNVLANKYLMDARLRASNDSLLFYHYNEDRDGLVVYNTFDITDSLLVQATLEDSLKQVAIDSFYLKFPETSRRPNEFTTSLRNVKASLETKMITGNITYTKPLQEIRVDSIHIYVDSLTSYYINDEFQYSIDSLTNTLEFSITTPQNIIDSVTNTQPQPRGRDTSTKTKSAVKKYNLVFPAGTYYSIENDTSQQLQQELKFSDATKTGIITGSITTEYPSYFIQLLDKNYTVVQETSAGKNYTFSDIVPDEYFIRILIDEDENGTWDHSDIRFNRMAEPIILYKDESGNTRTAVRANWEINVDLEF